MWKKKWKKNKDSQIKGEKDEERKRPPCIRKVTEVVSLQYSMQLCLGTGNLSTLFWQLTCSKTLTLRQCFICPRWWDPHSSESLSYPIQQVFCHVLTGWIASYNMSALLLIAAGYTEAPSGLLDCCGASIKQIKYHHDKTWCMGNL